MAGITTDWVDMYDDGVFALDGGTVWAAGTLDTDGVVSEAIDINSVGFEGALRGRMRRTAGGVEFVLNLLVGSDTHFSTEGYSLFGLDLFLRPQTDLWWLVPALAYDDSADRWWNGTARAIRRPGYSEPAPIFFTVTFGTNATPMSDTVPFTWAAGDRLVFGNALEAFDN